jgi:hypothetical protein
MPVKYSISAASAKIRRHGVVAFASETGPRALIA